MESGVYVSPREGILAGILLNKHNYWPHKSLIKFYAWEVGVAAEDGPGIERTRRKAEAGA